MIDNMQIIAYSLTNLIDFIRHHTELSLVIAGFLILLTCLIYFLSHIIKTDRAQQIDRDKTYKEYQERNNRLLELLNN